MLFLRETRWRWRREAVCYVEDYGFEKRAECKKTSAPYIWKGYNDCVKPLELEQIMVEAT